MRVLIYTIIFICILGYYITIKNTNAFNMRKVIMRAIYIRRLYFMNIGEDDKLYDVDYSDMEPYDRTLWRLWDWSYKHILPYDKFELIKNYISEKEIVE